MPAPALPQHLLSRPGEAVEHSADALASQALDGTAAPRLQPGCPGPQLPPGTPPSVLAQADHGQPLAPGMAMEYGRRLGSDLHNVRIHTDDAAAGLAEDAGALAFTIGSHIFFNTGEFSPQTLAGAELLTHELAHVVTAPPGRARLLRQPKGGAKSDVKPQQKDPKAEHWERLQVTASGLDDAALRLADVGAADQRNYLYIGLTSSFAKAYNTQGRPLGPKVPFKEDSKVSFVPGIYIEQRDGSLAAIEFESHDLHRQRLDIDAKGHGRSVFATRPLTKQEQIDTDKEREQAEKEGRDPKQTMTPLSLRKLLTEPDKLQALIGSVSRAELIYFVPVIASADGGKGGGEQATVYASPIAGRGDGLPANSPPWPVSIEGPKMVPIDSSPTYSAKVDWSANGNYTVAAQAFSQVGESIHYVWEYFDITKYARQQIAKDPAHTKDQPADETKRTLDQRIEDFKAATPGEGTDVTGTKAARREFRREFEDWWKDNRRAAKDARHPHGETTAERLMNAEANRVTLELAPVSLLITTIGAIAHFLADLFAGPRQQQEINLDEDGIYLIRVITTPAVNEDREGKPIIRPPSVAGHVVEVMPMASALEEALDEPSTMMAALDADIALAVKSGNKAKAEYLRDLKKRAQEQYTASPVTLLTGRLEEKEKELKKFKADYPSLSAYSREREIGTLKAQIQLYEDNERDRLATFGGDVAPQAMTRVNATLISEVSAQVYPLMMTAGPVGGTGTRHRWMINDITQLDTGGAYIGELRDTASEAFHSALEKFGQAAQYGRGMVGARTKGLPGMEKGALKQFKVESAPADTALAMKRIDDLVMTLAAVGLFVASAGTAGAVIGAVVAGARLIQRWKAHKLSLNGETVSDILGVLGGLTAGGALVSQLHLERVGKAFTIVEEGAVSAPKLESAAQALQRAESLAEGVKTANELIGYAGVIWGNVEFADQMLAINAQENDPNSGMTHAAARRARADALNAAIQNNGLFLAGNMLKSHAEAKAGTTAENDRASAGKTPTVERPAGGETLPPGDHAPADTTPSTEQPAAQKQAGHRLAEQKPGDPRPEDQKPTAKKPADKARPEEHASLKEESTPETEDAKKAQGEVKPQVEDRRPTPAELINALPEDLRKMAVIDDTLKGDSVKIDWTPDKSGLVGEIKIRISPDALPRTVALHEATVRSMQQYQGFLGRVRVALARITNMLGGDALDPTNKPLFDAKHEVAKLPKLINEHLQAMASMRSDALAEAEVKLYSLRNQLQEHMGKIEVGELTPSSGVSARGVAKADMAEYQRLLAKLQGLEPGSKSHEETRWRMYKIDHGELPPETWRKVYRANVERANRANDIVKAERRRLGWPEREYTVKLGKEEVRRLDLADDSNPAKMRGAEVKAYAEGTVYLSDDNLYEVERDSKLVRRGWEMTWIFIDCEPSGPLMSALLSAGINIEIRTPSERSSRLDRRIPAPVQKK
ncbi:DUF4157 domain-containing protein [Streptomyces sp. NBC_01643]|uniref:eCIS core domain-containing protein n=1 Tax=Streptomyces sp. NBC_01643 TaxID=2975906 RepID=UPI00386E3508|nr:DUF4157 domain-containing protein [Streptomyces sp. NBC_01643]